MRRRHALSLLPLLGGAALAAPNVPTAPLRAAVLDVRPWGWMQGERLCGAYSDWFAQFEAVLGQPVQRVLRPLARARQELASGEVDLALMLTQTDLVGLSLGEVARLELVMIGAERGRLGVLRGAALPPAAMAPRWQRQPLSSARQQLSMLAKGRLDAVVGVRQNFEVASAEVQLASAVWATLRPMGEVPLQLWLSPQWRGSPLEAKARQAVVSMRQQLGPVQLAAWANEHACLPSPPLSPVQR
jgi:hypothetical protein